MDYLDMGYFDILSLLIKLTANKVELSYLQVASAYTGVIATFVLTFFFNLSEGMKKSIYRASKYSCYVIMVVSTYFVINYSINFVQNSSELSVDKADKKLTSAMKDVDK